MRRSRWAKSEYENGAAFRGCRFCHGLGCLACEKEAEKEYARQFPNGPQPLATFRLDDPEDVAKAKETIGAAALEKTFGPEGGGMSELIENLRRVGKLNEEAI